MASRRNFPLKSLEVWNLGGLTFTRYCIFKVRSLADSEPSIVVAERVYGCKPFYLRLPKPTNRLLGPLNYLTSDHQLTRAQAYADGGMEFMEGIVQEHPHYTKSPDFADVVEQSKQVTQYMDAMLERPNWTHKACRELKHETRKFHANAKRTSQRAKQARYEAMTDSSHSPDDAASGRSTPPPALGQYIEAITASESKVSNDNDSYVRDWISSTGEQLAC
ncbi:hypothetical protein C8Q76DRAFT_851999 [Earliella scabrosa]|nr:hypothetical protein C8Q76DRAFT_851999 [Earliella scabrosa]